MPKNYQKENSMMSVQSKALFLLHCLARYSFFRLENQITSHFIYICTSGQLADFR